MSSNEKNDSGTTLSDEGSRRGRTRRVWVIWAAVCGFIVLLMLFKERMEAPAEVLSQYQFEQLVDSNRIARAIISYNPQNSVLNEIVGLYYRPENDSKIEVPFRATIRLTPGLEARLLRLPQFEPRESNTLLFSLAVSVLPIIAIAALIWFFFIRQIKKAARTSPTRQELHAKESEQQARFDGILDKWEAQARRMDAVLDKMERISEVKR